MGEDVLASGSTTMTRALSLARAAALTTLGLLARPDDLHAQDRWRQPHAGVRHLHRRAGLFDYHLVTVDLATARPRFVATEESFLDPRRPGAPRVWRTTSDFARHVGADLAVNANYFDIRHGRFGTCGLAMARGRAWRSSYADRRLDCDWTVGFGARGRVDVFDTREKVLGPAPTPWITEAVSGSPRVLGGGQVLSYTHPRHALQRNPRTILGVDRARSTLFVLMVNGREGRNQGMTCPEAARVLRDHGAWDAVNLDGGGSSALYLRAEGGLVSHPADGVERGVGNHLGLIFGAEDETETPAPEGDPSPVADGALLARTILPEAPAPAPRVVRAGCAVGGTRRSAPQAAGWCAVAVVIAARRSRGASRRPRGSG